MFFFPLFAEKEKVIHTLCFIAEKNVPYVKFVDKSTKLW